MKTEPIQDLFQFQLGDCPPKEFQGKPIINPYWKRKEYEDNHKPPGDGFIGVTLPTELRPSQPIPDWNSQKDLKLIADVWPSLDFTDTTFDTTFQIADLGG